MRRRNRPTASQLLFRWIAALLVIAVIACGWLFYRKFFAPGSRTAQAAKATDAPTGQTAPPDTDAAPTESLTETAAPTKTEPATEPPEPGTYTVTLLAVGDNLIHDTVYRSGWNTNPWNYDHLYKHVRDDIQAADIAVINQETIFVKDHKYVSNYPAFGTPREIGDAVYKAGFDVILHASNHVLDMGVENIYDAVDYWSDKDVTVLGIHKSAEDAAVPKIVEKNGIKIGMINYTYGLNGFELPADQPYAVDLLDYRDKLLADIAYLEKHADITVAFLHMGTEYSTVPDAYSKEMVELVVSHGVDLCINGHPHVVEPCEEYTAVNGNKAVVFYSLGNFISSQDKPDRLLGGMAKVTIRKTVTEAGTVTKVTEHSLEPLVTHTSRDTTYSVYHLEDYSDYLGERNLYCRLKVKDLWTRWHQIVGE